MSAEGAMHRLLCRISQAKGQSQKKYEDRFVRLLFFQDTMLPGRGEMVFYWEEQGNVWRKRRHKIMMDAVNNVIVQISDVVWNYLLLFFTGGYGDLFHDPHPVRSGPAF